MLIAALIVGALTAYYFGLRRGVWAAAATFALLAVAAFVPRMQWPAYLLVAAAAVAVRLIGARRPRPPDAVLAVHWVKRAVSQLFGKRDD
jgi:hypothetical protein